MRFYGFLSNCHTGALVSGDGSIDWLPFPRFDSAAVFAKLLGADRNGFFAIRPADAPFSTEQHYLEDTNILKTTFTVAGGGMARVIDYLVIGTEELRRAVSSTVPLEMVLRPVFQNGLIAAAIELTEHGAKYTNPTSGEAVELIVHSTPAPDYQAAQETWRLPPGRYDLRLVYHPDQAAQELDVDQGTPGPWALRRNIRFWQRAARIPYRGPFARELRRSLLVLHGLTYRTNGAVIAAPTTSLPETVGGTRQWDYRFAWVRDGSYAAEALLAAGDVVTPRRMLEFFLSSVDLQGKPFKAPFFRVDGTLIRGERELNWLKGYRGSRPVRDGNGATGQLQMDIEGDLMWALWRYYTDTADDQFVRSYAGTIESLMDWVAQHWNEKDASLWEFRGQDDHYTHSKLMCWVCLHYGARMIRATGRRASADRYRQAADQVAEAIRDQGYNADRGTYVQAFGGSQVDAALLTLVLYGFVDVRDDRFQGTLKAIEADLVEDGFVYRYRNDMLGEATNPFLLASYWLARVYIRLGQLDRASAIVGKVLHEATDLGLLGEHMDAETHEPRGNFPQGFSHLGAVITILELAEARGDRIGARLGNRVAGHSGHRRPDGGAAVPSSLPGD